jgi:toxin ParE1/3/4
VRIDWTDLALDRVEEIALYIAADNSEAAIRWTTELFEAVGHLSEFPQSGRLVPGSSTGSAKLSECSVSDTEAS